MKKMRYVIPALLLALLLSACGGRAALNPASPSASALPPESAVPTPADSSEPSGAPYSPAPTHDSRQQEAEAEFTALLQELNRSYFPATAGSSTVGAVYAAHLADLLTEYPSLSAFVAEFGGDALTDVEEKAAFAAQMAGLERLFRALLQDGTGNAVPVFISRERNRYYYAGESRFANIGSNGANDSIHTTVQYDSGVLIDLETESEALVVPDLIPLHCLKEPIIIHNS